MYLERKVETEFGTVRVKFTEANHAHVGSGDSSGDAIEVRGKRYRVSAHLFADHDWRPKDGSYTSVQHDEWTNYSKADAAPTIRAKILDACRQAVLDIVEREPDILHLAEIDYVNQHLATALNDARDAEAKWRTASAVVGEWHARLKLLQD